MYLVLAGVLAIILKYMEVGAFTELSWWWVLSPFAAAVVWWSWADSSGYTKRRELQRESRRVEERRRRHLEDMGLAGFDGKRRR